MSALRSAGNRQKPWTYPWVATNGSALGSRRAEADSRGRNRREWERTEKLLLGLQYGPVDNRAFEQIESRERTPCPH